MRLFLFKSTYCDDFLVKDAKRTSRSTTTGCLGQGESWRTPLEFWQQDGEFITPKWVWDSKLVNEIIKATCVLHNFLQSQSTPAQVTNLLQKSEDISAEGFKNLAGSGNRGGRDTITIRNTFMEYFVDYSPVAWQIAHINRGFFTAWHDPWTYPDAILMTALTPSSSQADWSLSSSTLAADCSMDRSTGGITLVSVL